MLLVVHSVVTQYCTESPTKKGILHHARSDITVQILMEDHCTELKCVWRTDNKSRLVSNYWGNAGRLRWANAKPASPYSCYAQLHSWIWENIYYRFVQRRRYQRSESLDCSPLRSHPDSPYRVQNVPVLKYPEQFVVRRDLMEVCSLLIGKEQIGFPDGV